MEVFIPNSLRGEFSSILPRTECLDGFTVSIQAGSGYSEPRVMGVMNSESYPERYTAVELGFPSEADEVIAEYAEDPDDLTGTVYPFVPVEVVVKLLLKHGGVKGGHFLPLCRNAKLEKVLG